MVHAAAPRAVARGRRRYAIATGPHATLSGHSRGRRPARARRRRRARRTSAPSGASPTRRRRCRAVHDAGTEQSELTAMARAADSAMWIADFGCDALLRVTSAGARCVLARGGHELRPWVSPPTPAGACGSAPPGTDARRPRRCDGRDPRASVCPRARPSATDIAGAADGTAVARARALPTVAGRRAGGSVATDPVAHPGSTARVRRPWTDSWLAARPCGSCASSPGEPAACVRPQWPRRARCASACDGSASPRCAAVYGLRYRVERPRDSVVAQGFYDDRLERRADGPPGRQRMACPGGPRRRRAALPRRRHAQLRRFARRLTAGGGRGS